MMLNVDDNLFTYKSHILAQSDLSDNREAQLLRDSIFDNIVKRNSGVVSMIRFHFPSFQSE